jgi:hypothetical protein
VHDEGYFDERVAPTYDESAADTFEPAVTSQRTKHVSVWETPPGS